MKDTLIKRHETLAVRVASVVLGGGAPVVVQSMTDTDTQDVDATVQQCRALAQAGSELVRITVNTEKAAQQVAVIRQQLDDHGCRVPLVGDFHYNGHHLLAAYPGCAQALAKYRINPGNVGFGQKKDTQFAQMIAIALEYDKPVRIGVNWGSLEKSLLAKKMDQNAQLAAPKTAACVVQDALIESVLRSAEYAQSLGLAADKIVLSCKVSCVQSLVSIYQQLAKQCNYALHLGLTEAGMGHKGIVASSIAMGILLQQGIGDTIRTSLTPEPGAPRTTEVRVSQQMLQSMGLRYFTPQVTACPGCGRTTSVFFRELTAAVDEHISQQMPRWKGQFPGVEALQLAVMGCVVNGPGESKHADVGISLPGTGETPVAPVFIDGKKAFTLRGQNIAAQFLTIIDNYVINRYG